MLRVAVAREVPAVAQQAAAAQEVQAVAQQAAAAQEVQAVAAEVAAVAQASAVGVVAWGVWPAMQRGEAEMLLHRLQTVV